MRLLARSCGAALAVALGALATAPAPAAAQGSSRLEQPGSLSDRYLTPPEVRDVLHRAGPTFDLCFFEHVGAELPGEITLRFVVPGDGTPIDIELDIDERFGALASCLEAVVADQPFDAHDGDPLAVAYPLVFVRDERGSRTVPYPIVFVRPRERLFLWLAVPPSLSASDRAALEGWLYPGPPHDTR